MQIFVVLGTLEDEREKIGARLEEHYEGDHLIESGLIFIAANEQTSQDVCRNLGIGVNGERRTGIVIGMDAYSGYYSSAVVEWIRLKRQSNGR